MARVFARLGMAVLGVALLAGNAEAAGGLDVRGWLDRPGVKLLAVEFYATWCKPCMEAVPRWKALHEEYRQQGLRLVVVATQDPEAGCVNPGWNPDDVICDDDGTLARMMGAGERLPAAFLWSWQGNLLVRRGHVEEVEKSIEAWMTQAPVVDVRVQGIAPGAGIGVAELRDLVRDELGRSAKLTVVASEEERKRLDELKKRSFSERFDDKTRCDLGKELSPNSLLNVRVTGKSRKRISLSLLSLERGCLIRNSVVDWNRGRPGVAVAEGVAELVQKLRPTIQMPRSKGGSAPSPRTRFGDEDFGETPEEWDPGQTGAQVIATFASDPPGAVVLVDGNLLCQNTSRGCSRALSPGRYQVTMQRERYQKRSERISLSESATIEWKLQPNFGRYAITSDPPNLEVQLDGRKVGVTPLEKLEVDRGRHAVLVSDPCYFDRGKRIDVRSGDNKTFDFQMKPRMGAIKVVAVDSAGNAKPGEVWVDGKDLGPAPAVYKLPICAKNLEIRQGAKVVYSGALAVREKTVVNVRAVVSSAPVAVPERPSSSGAVYVYMSGSHVDARDLPKAEATALRDALKLSQSVVPLTSLSGLSSRLSTARGLVMPELEKGAPSLSSSDKSALRRFVEGGGVMVTVLDDPVKARGLGVLRDVFGWRLRSDGSPKGKSSRRVSGARALGFRGPPTLPHNNDTDVILKDSLPTGGRALYTDDGGNPTVAVVPSGAGYVAILGWDWFDGKPRGKVDGGWNQVLAGIFGLRLESAAEPAPPAPPSGGEIAVTGTDILFYANSSHVDYDPKSKNSEGAGMEKALLRSRQRVKRVTSLDPAVLRRELRGASVLVIPDLEKGDPKASRPAQAVMRDFVSSGGTLLAAMDESGKDRAAKLVNEIFGWRLAVESEAKGSKSGRQSVVKKWGFRGPRSIRHNNDTDALKKASLPSSSAIFYADSSGNATVSALPFGSGQVVFLGWDWYDGKPLGRQDGGWLSVLQGVLRMKRPGASSGSTAAAAVGGPRGAVLFMDEPRFTDVRVGKTDAEASNLRAALEAQGHAVSTAYLGALKNAYSRSADYRAVVVPELNKGAPKDVQRAIRGARRHLRSYVAKGGTLVVTLDDTSKSRCFTVLNSVFGWGGLKSKGMVKGRGQLDGRVASDLGYSGLGSTLAANNDTDVILTSSLPKGGKALYRDDDGESVVAVVPYRNGRVVILGWDWFDAAPVGKLDGGWRKLLSALLR